MTDFTDCNDRTDANDLIVYQNPFSDKQKPDDVARLEGIVSYEKQDVRKL